MKTGIELIADERREQIKKHGRTIEQDVIHNYERQLQVGAAKLLSDRNDTKPPEGWDVKIWTKMRGKRTFDKLIIAGALIAAEVDRLQAIEQGTPFDEGTKGK